MLDAEHSVLVVAGEPSGDLHGANLIRAIRRQAPHLTFFGMGGSALRSVGVETVLDSESAASVMGVAEVLGSLKKSVRAFRQLVDEVRRRKPDLAILIDYPDFNLRLAEVLHGDGVKVFYYIGPQIWAWRKGRTRTVKANVDRLAVIFPFEESFYRRRGIEAEYVGHPFLDEPWPQPSREEICSRLGLSPSLPLVAFLPGSRAAEVQRLLPVMARAFHRLQAVRPGVQGVVPVAPGLSSSMFASTVGLLYTSLPARAILSVADVAVVASGTATVEAALARVPFFVVYRFVPLTYLLARLLVRGVRHFAMANLIAGRRVVAELLQDDVTPENLVQELERLLGDPGLREKIRRELQGVRKRLELGKGDGQTAAERAARLCLELLPVSRSVKRQANAGSCLSETFPVP